MLFTSKFYHTYNRVIDKGIVMNLYNRTYRQ